MRDSWGLGLDEEMLVPITIAEYAGLDGNDVIKTASYPPLGLIFRKIGIYSLSLHPVCHSVLIPSIFPSQDRSPNKWYQSDKGIFRAGVSRSRPCAQIRMQLLCVESMSALFLQQWTFVQSSRAGLGRIFDGLVISACPIFSNEVDEKRKLR